MQFVVGPVVTDGAIRADKCGIEVDIDKTALFGELLKALVEVENGMRMVINSTMAFEKVLTQ